MTARNGSGFTSLENHLGSLPLTQYNLSRKSPKFDEMPCQVEILSA